MPLYQVRGSRLQKTCWNLPTGGCSAQRFAPTAIRFWRLPKLS